jgi:hypothetical protein
LVKGGECVEAIQVLWVETDADDLPSLAGRDTASRRVKPAG